MKELLKKIFFGEYNRNNLVEGLYAHQYRETGSTETCDQIREQYNRRWPLPDTNPTPLTHPWLFDPCEPPEGWIYDPYYEIWIERK